VDRNDQCLSRRRRCRWPSDRPGHLAERRQAVRDENQRRHEIEEARFASRRDAYVSFAAACQKTITRTDDFENEHAVLPGDMGYNGPHRGVIDALELVLIIGPKEAISAATEASLRLHEWAFGNGSRTAAVDAVDEFQAVSRPILKFDSVHSKR
jgi:hypothetical protein